MKTYRPIRLTVLAAAVVALAFLPAMQASAQIARLAERLSQRRDQAKAAAAQFGSPAAKPAKAAGAAITSQTVEMGLEINEQLPPRALLQDSPELKRLLGTAPAFVYDPHSRPDPMVIPWSRSRVMFRELTAIAQAAAAAKKWDAAENAYKRILAELPMEQYRALATQGLAEIAALKAQDMQNVGEDGAGVKVAKLPPWVQANTIGIIRDAKEPMVLVGSFVLKAGDLVPQQPVEVTVAKIDGSSVFYKVQDKTFEVQVMEGE